MRKMLKNLFVQKTVVILLVIAVAGTALLAFIVHFYPVLSPDIAISHKLQNEDAAILPPAMNFISFFGDSRVAAISLLFFAAAFFALSCWREALFLLLTLPADGVNFLLKLLVNRPRPSGQLVEVYHRLSDPSFPSGHVVHYVVFFGFIFVTMFTVKKLPFFIRLSMSAASLALILLVSISRVYLGVHWVTDVIGGYLLGFAMLFVIMYFYLREPKNLRIKKFNH